MRKRIGAVLLTLAMLLSLFPLPVLAEETSDSGMLDEETLIFDGTDSGIPEFVPGVIPEESNFTYPTYERRPGGPNRAPRQQPESYDGRSVQSPVKSQGSNGLCWTFGTYAAVESYMKTHGGSDVDFSELHMGYSTSISGGNTEQGYSTRTTPGSGGNRLQSSAYLMRGTKLSGTVDEADDPYIKTELQPRELSISESKEQTYQVQNILFLTGNERPTVDEVNAIKTYIQSNGGVGASMYWNSNNATATTGGNESYNPATAAYYYDGNHSGTNHLIEIVGWDDNYAKENFNAAHQPKENGAWLIKNSWGASWGDGGYGWISYEDHNFPLNAFCIDGVKPYDHSETVYETDYTPSGSAWGYNNEKITKAYFARVFTADTSDENLKSVRVLVNQPCEIAVNCVSEEYLTGGKYEFDSQGRKSASYPGWYTIDLTTPTQLPVGAGEKFAVVVELSTTTTTNELFLCYDSNDNNAISSGEGCHGYWNNLQMVWSSNNNVNYCIKAVTTPANKDQAIADKAANELTWDMIRNENTAENQVCTDLNLPTEGKYGTTISWSSEPNIISESGMVTPGTENVSVTLTATVTFGGKSAVKTFALTVIGVPSDMENVVNGITWDSIKGSNTAENAVTSNLNLNVSPPDGITVTWKSSNTALIGTDGTVTRPRFDKKNNVTLTATVGKGSARKNVTFELNVSNLEATDEAKAVALLEWFDEDWTGNWWPLIRGENQSYSTIRTDLTKPERVTFTAENGQRVVVEVRSTSAKMKNPANPNGDKIAWDHVTHEGKVTRPAYGEENSKGYYYIFFNGYSNSSSLALTVLAYQGAVTASVSSKTVTAGEISGTLTAQTTQQGNPGTLSYQWYSAASAAATTGTAIPNANAKEFSIPTDLTVGTHYYYCEVSAPDAETAKSNIATVTVEKGTTESVAITADMVALSSTSLTYTGDALEPVVTVRSGSTMLVKNTDYTLTYQNNINAGEATVIVTGLGNYRGTVTKTFTIEKAAQTAPSIPTAANITDTSITLNAITNAEFSRNNTDWQSSCTFDGLQPNTQYTFYVRLKENANHFASPSSSASFTTKKTSLEHAVVTVSGSYTYSATAQTPAAENVKVVLNGTTIAPSQYTVSASNNVNAGNAAVTVTASETGNYSGQASGTFHIAQAPLTIQANDQTITYGDEINKTVNQVTVTGLRGADALENISLTANTANNTITPSSAEIRNSGNDVSGNYTITYQSGTLTVRKSRPTITFNHGYSLDKTYDGQTIPNPAENALTITGADFRDVVFSWNNTPQNAGTYTLTAQIPETLHSEAASATLTVTIHPKTLDNPTIELSNNRFVYDGNAKTPAVTVKDGSTVIPTSEYSVSYHNNVNAGTATVTITDNLNGNYTVNGSAQFEITRADPPTLTISGQPETVTYGDTFRLTAASNASFGTITWSASGPAEIDANGNVTITGTGSITITASQESSGNYNASHGTLTFTAERKALTVTDADTVSRQYNGTSRVTVTSVTLDGTINNDAVSVDTSALTGVLSSPNAGTYSSVTLSGMTLTGEKAKHYVLVNPNVTLDHVETILSKADALAPKPGTLTVTNQLAHTYTYELDALLPDPPEYMSLGSTPVTYTLDEVNLGDYYTTGAAVSGQTLTLPVQAVENETAGPIGTVTVTIQTENFADMTATIQVRSVNKITPSGEPTLSAVTLTYGQPLSTITLSGNMKDGETDVPGTFLWSNPDEYPAVQEAYQAAWVFTPNDTSRYATVKGTATIKINKAAQTPLVISGQPDTVTYGDVFQLTTLGGSGDGIVTWNANGPARVNASGTVTITGTGSITITAVKAGNADFSDATDTVTFTAGKKALVVTEVSASSRKYNGTSAVTVTSVALSGAVTEDDVAVDTTNLTGTVSSPNVGNYTSAVLPTLTLTGGKAENYTLTQPSGEVHTAVTISKADALTARSGELTVSNGKADTYTFNLSELLPDAPDGMSLGTVSYALDTISLNDYYTTGAAVNGQTLTLPIQAVESETAGEIGTVAIVIHTENFEDMTAVIRVSTMAKIVPIGQPVLSSTTLTYGQPLSTITLSGNMKDGETDVPGTFTWNNPDDCPAVQEAYQAAWVFAPNDISRYATVKGTATIKVVKAEQAELVISGQPDTVTYGNTFTLTALGGSGDGIVTWSANGPARVNTSGTVTIIGTGPITITAVKAGNAEFNDATDIVTFTAEKKTLTVTEGSASDRQYNGTGTVAVTSVVLSGVVAGDDVSVDTTNLTGTVSSPNVGNYTSVVLPALTLTGGKAENYTLIQPSGEVRTTVTISKADALTVRSGELTVSNGKADTYTFNLSKLTPDAPDGMSLGTVSYVLGTVDLNDYYTTGADVSGQTLTLPIQAVESETAGEIGTITVVIHTENFEDMTAVIRVNTIEKIVPTGQPILSSTTLAYGQPLSTITLSGNMKDGETDVPGTFLWSNPDEHPAVQEAYQAAWVFMPNNTSRYATVKGTATIKVDKAEQTELVISGQPDAVAYGDTFKLTASGGSGDGTVTWNASGPASVDQNGNVTITGVGRITITAVKAGNSGFEEAKGMLTFTAEKKVLTVTEVSASDRQYNGTGTVEVTSVSLSGVAAGDDVSVDTSNLTGIVSSSNAGSYTSVILPTLTLTGGKAENYTLTQPSGEVRTSVTISKANALTARTGELTIFNGKADTYTFNLNELTPDAPNGMSLGTVSYALDMVNLNDYYTTGAAVNGQTLTLPIQAVESETTGEVGTVNVVIRTENFEDTTAVIHVRTIVRIVPTGQPALSSTTLTYGQPLRTIILSGSMKDGEMDVPGTFTWSNPDNCPAVQEAYQAAWIFTPNDTNRYATVKGTAIVKINKAEQLPLVISGQPDTVTYGDTFTLTVSGGSGDGAVTWNASGPASVDENGTVTITGVGRITITAVKAGDNGFSEAKGTLTFTAERKTLTVTEVSASDRQYNGTNTIAVTSVTLKGVAAGDDVSIDTTNLTGTVSSSNAGDYTSIVLPALALTGKAAENYTLTQPSSGEVRTSVTISKADALTAQVGELTVSNGKADTYTFNLSALNPDVPNGMSLGNVSYVLDTVDLNDYYAAGADVSGQILTLPIQAVESETAGEIGTIMVVIHTENFENMTAAIRVYTADRIVPIGQPVLSATTLTYGQTLSAIELSGNMRDGETNVPGTFTWSNPDDCPAAQEAYQAEWVFTPDDTSRYATVKGTATIKVDKAEQAELVISGRPDTVTYGDTFKLIASGGSGDGAVTWNVDGPARVDADGNVTIIGAGRITITAVKAGDSEFGEAKGTLTFSAEKKVLTVTEVSTSDRQYNGTTTVTVTSVALSGVVVGDDVSVDTSNLTGTVSSPNVGSYTSVVLPVLTLTGEKAENYTLTQPSEEVRTAVTISKADALTARSGELTVSNGKADTYSFNLSALNPDVPNGMSLGTVSYALGTVDLNDYYTTGAAVSDQTLTLPIQSVESKSEEQIGTVTIVIQTENFEDMAAVIRVSTVNQTVLTGQPVLSSTTLTYGQPLSTITLSGSMKDGETDVPGVFAWKHPNEKPNAQSVYAAAWIFTPADSNAYAAVSGAVNVTVDQATPTGTPRYTAITASGKTLADAKLSAADGAFSVAGYVTWTLPETTEVMANTEYEWIFTPADRVNYHTLTGRIQLWTQHSTSSNGSGTSTVTTPVKTSPSQTGASSVQTTATPAAVTKGNTATAKVNASTSNEIVKQAVSNKSGSVVVAPEIKGSVTKTEVSVPSSMMKQIGSKTEAGLTVSTPVAEVTIPNGGLSELSKTGSTVTITAEQTGNMVELSVTADGKPVENPSSGLTLTVPAPNAAPGTVAALVREDGTRQIIRKSVADGSRVIVPLDGPAKLEILDNGKRFRDVPDNSWAADAVSFVSAHELFSGTGSDQFSPDLPMSRGMLAVVLHNLEGNPRQAFANAFADVRGTAWYADGVAWAAEHGIISGYDGNRFGPDDNITREQLAVMLWRYAGSPTAVSGTLRFSDADTASDWAQNALLWAVEQGILSGKGGGILDPLGKATRAQAAQMLKNFILD